MQEQRLMHAGSVAGESAGATVLWLAAAAAGGFLLSYVLVDRWALPRNAFVLGHVVLTGLFFAAYAWWSRVGPRELLGDARRGLLGGLVAGAFMVAFVLSGPSSPAPAGWDFAGAIVWVGIVYATIDALLLSVFPVLAANRLAQAGALGHARKPAALMLAALGMSLALTITYHLGFPEFRGAALLGALIGNATMTLAYLVTRSALAAVLAHIALHIAAVSWGFANALPAPPHY